MKLRNIIGSMLALGLLAGCATEKEGDAAAQAKLESQAKVSKAEAQQIAQAKVPGGTVKEAGIEKEKGKVIWSFEFASPGTKVITEVNVDAMTGAVVGIDKE